DLLITNQLLYRLSYTSIFSMPINIIIHNLFCQCHFCVVVLVSFCYNKINSTSFMDDKGDY
ncbi:MAG: hypothetical protein RSD19_08165, partial [Oscillospiraceae bacterium]